MRILLDRPDARNAQNRGLLVELDDAFLRAEADDDVRVVILGGTGPLFSSGHDMGSKVAMEEYHDRTRPCTINGGTRKGAEKPDAAGVALLLREHAAAGATCARSPSPRCTGTVFAAGLMLMWACDLIVGADDARVRRRRRHPPGHVRRRVLRPPVGVRPPQDQGAHADRRLASTSTRPTAWAW